MNSVGTEKIESLRREIIRLFPRPQNDIVSVGDFTTFLELNVLDGVCDEQAYLSIGKFCTIGRDFLALLGTEHDMNANTTYNLEHWSDCLSAGRRSTYARGNISIGNDVYIGSHVTIRSGVSVGDGCIIESGTMLTKSVEPYRVVCGNPCFVKEKRFSEEQIAKLLTMKWWNWDDYHLYEALDLIRSEDTSRLYDYYLENINMI